ncbi:hypothetical protein TFKS16_0248 [Tannerella forsythia KS16]|uniref:Uncharacterized protein n=1 Tax=Tannerella forsythia (strain ATCC 43037 / JCM 10827 / CCUG 21028 A / KCTC 5666 / FDC 338) TaxID=203275 RepID=G8UJI2_TANFA|nr:hypothetical protein BFO_0255 [Tannerella forsythia 92A2]BAR47823.1 hypothetical protein TF3313_0221 [Tannerella forsythia 3313]BAR50584.1 hypothetical protein TFKS16_0248 [Tannerella forsythia KS16]
MSCLFVNRELYMRRRYAQKRIGCAFSYLKTLKSEIIHYFCKR